MWNGAVLVQDTSHEYLHVIERLDRDRFDYITHFMVTMNINKKLDKYSLKQITVMSIVLKLVLSLFARDHISVQTAFSPSVLRVS